MKKLPVGSMTNETGKVSVSVAPLKTVLVAIGVVVTEEDV